MNSFLTSYKNANLKINITANRCATLLFREATKYAFLMLIYSWSGWPTMHPMLLLCLDGFFYQPLRKWHPVRALHMQIRCWIFICIINRKLNRTHSNLVSISSTPTSKQIGYSTDGFYWSTTNSLAFLIALYTCSLIFSSL